MGNIGATELIIILLLIIIFIVVPIILIVWIIKLKTENKFLKMENIRLLTEISLKK